MGKWSCMVTLTQEKILQGIGISEGVLVGPLVFLTESARTVKSSGISPSQVSKEIERYRVALEQTKEDLLRVQEFFYQKKHQETQAVLSAYLTILKDPLLTHNVEEKIRTEYNNAETVFLQVTEQYQGSVLQRAHPDRRDEMLLDLQDLFDRVLDHLLPPKKIEEFPPNAILYSYELAPSRLLRLENRNDVACVTKMGSETSHTGLIARARGIPYVANIDLGPYRSLEGCTVVVSGDKGEVVLHPSVETQKKVQLQTFQRSCCAEGIPNVDLHQLSTKDGKSIKLQANISSLSDINQVKQYAIRDVGLVRSELLFDFSTITDLTELEQYQVYKALCAGTTNCEVAFRLFDFGGDKPHGTQEIIEPNPALGNRSIRYLLSNKQLLCQQIRALFRAFKERPLNILLPLIADIEEVRASREVIEQCRRAVSEELGIVVGSVKLGCMVEVPAFVVTCEHFIEEVDFLSIGTNDLFQFTLGVDRLNPSVAHLFPFFHPSMLRMLKLLVQATENTGVSLTICGEMAAKAEYVPLFIGLGINSFSVAPRHMATLCSLIKNIQYTDACALTKDASRARTAKQIEKLLLEFVATT